MHSESNAVRGLTIAVLSFVWLGVCLASWRFNSDDFARFMIFGWLVTVVALPLLFGYVGTLLLAPAPSYRVYSRIIHWSLSLLTIVLAALAYAMCVAVLERISAVWWEHVKFGGTAISLGKAAAEHFSIVAILVGMGAYALHKFAALGRIAILCRATLGLVTAASLLYLALGLSPYAEWRT